MRAKQIAIPAGLITALLVLGACGSDTPAAAPQEPRKTVASPETSASDRPRKSGAEISVKIIDTDFKPNTVTIQVGSTVNWKQIGDQPHSVTAADGSFDSSPDCGPLDSDKCLGQGSAFSHTFDEAGEFTYYCRVHGLPDGTGMVGSVIVR